MKKIQLRRIIASGKFIPEIDGLRFIAILSVVLYHINNFLAAKNTSSYSTDYNNSFTPNFISNGSLGVELFFVISGFVLGLFFARNFRNGNQVDLKSYFLRRLTRLEPPYILSLLILFFATVYVARTLPIKEAFQSLLASIFYVHNFIYPNIFPKIMTVAWSLEVEVQFYILAPILGLIFKIQNSLKRKSIIVLLCLLFPILSYSIPLGFVSIYDYMSYFLLGFLITDLFLDHQEGITITKYSTIITFLFFTLLILFFTFKTTSDTLLETYYIYGHLAILFCLFYIVLIFRNISFLKLPWVSNIGGACYSIYLLHFPIISFIGRYIIKIQFTDNRLIDNIIHGSILLLTILLISFVFFILIERPCMDKEWVKKLFRSNLQ